MVSAKWGPWDLVSGEVRPWTPWQLHFREERQGRSENLLAAVVFSIPSFKILITTCCHLLEYYILSPNVFYLKGIFVQWPCQWSSASLFSGPGNLTPNREGVDQQLKCHHGYRIWCCSDERRGRLIQPNLFRPRTSEVQERVVIGGRFSSKTGKRIHHLDTP